MVGSMTWHLAKVSVSEAADRGPCASVRPLHLLLSGLQGGMEEATLWQVD